MGELNNMKQCPACGHMGPATGRFCAKCGAKIGEINEQINNVYTNQSNANGGGEEKTVQRVARQVNESARNIVHTINVQRGFEYAEDDSYTDVTSVNQHHKSPSAPSPISGNSLGGFILADGEQPIRSYQCANVKSAGTGYLYVTNKRMMYEGKGVGNRIAMEAPIDSIGGINSYMGTNIQIKFLIIGVLLVIGGIVVMSNSRGDGSAIGILAIILGIIIAILGYRRAYQLMVYSNKNTGVAISIGEGPTSIFGNSAFYTLSAAPTRETEAMLSELGALVQDIQQLGDRAIEKWGR